ncbi:MAG: hypothetical protein IPI48_08310 [bacterium]|nr:hypothetical protein [bacterium]
MLAMCLIAVTASGAMAQYQADDFHACALDPAWTFVNAGDAGAAVGITGAYTDDAHLALSVPGGSTHEIWNTTIGAPHVLQPLAAGDFTAAVKFVSVLPTNFGQQGLLVRQSDSQWLRLEMYRNEIGQFRVAALGGPTTLFFDTQIVPVGATPLYLRVSRAADTWTLEWSQDGTVWQAAGAPFVYAFLPDGIGIYAGNRGANPPAHTVHADWFGVDGAGDDIERNTLAVDVVGGGQVTRGPDLANYTCAQDVTLTAVDQLGWTFSSWSGGLTGAANPAVVSMNGPSSVTATFTAVPVDTLATSLAGGGSLVLSPPGGVYNRGTVVTVTAVDGPGWVFSAFSGDLTGGVNPQTITMTGNRAVTANFSAVAQHTISTNVNPGGAGIITLNPAGGTYNAGTIVTVTAAGEPGWGFTGWSGDLAGATNPETLVVDGDKTVTATFAVLPTHVLTTTVSGNGQIVRQPDDPDYLSGSSVVLTAVPDSGWQFSGWSGDLTGNANPDTLLMNADKNVHATFTVIPPVFLTDDFNRCALGAPWSFVDPFNDGGTATLAGGWSDNARVAIYVPGGIEHEIWAGFIGAPHILQPAQDVDFTIEAKFDSDLPGNFGQEGILIKESETRWIRAEIFRDETNRLRVAVDRGPAILTHDVYMPLGLTAPLWMRVTRTGDTWVQSWSSDGVTWNVAGGPFNYDMTVTAVGLFAGNRGFAPPAHTVLVDYVHNTAGTPVAEDATRAPLDVTLDGGGLVNRTLNLASYGCGQVETLTAVDQPGWRFDSWSGAATGSQNPVQVTLNGAATVTAHFVPVTQFTLAASVAAGNGSVQLSPPGGVYNEGTTVVVTAVPDTDWSFTGWSGDLAGTANPDTLVMSADRTVAATFTEIIYAFASDDFNACTLDSVWTFVNPRGDAATQTLVGSYTDDARLALHVPSGAIHELWNGAITAPHLIQPALDVDFGIETKFDSALPNIALAQEGIIVRESDAIWLRFEFLSFGPMTHVLATLPDGMTIPVNVQIGLNGPYRMRVMRTGDTWNMQWSSDGVTWNTPAGSGFTYAMNVTGVGVYAGNNGTNPAHTVLVDYFKHTVGTWVDEDADRAPLAINVVGGGTVNVDPPLASYGCGQPVTLTPVAARGWTFTGWSGALGGAASPAVLGMSGPSAVTATFAPLPEESLVVSTTGGGGTVTLSPAEGPYYYGDRVILTAVDGAGWAFDSWTGDLTGAANPDTITVLGGMNVTANFVAVPQHTVTVTVPGGNGTVSLSPAGGTYNQGRAVILTAQGALGYGLGAWGGDLAGSANPDTIVVDADKNITATFAPLPQYALTTNIVGSGSVATNPAGPLHFAGTAVALAATPDNGWQFSGWSGDLVGSAAADTLVMTAPLTVTATFTPLPPVSQSDDFAACALDPRWTVVDPFNDGASATIVNAYTDSARVAIYVPGGFDHEIWNGVLGAAHILQPAYDRQQFTVEAKFDSRVPANFGQEGIIVKQDDAHWVRAEFFRDDFNNLRVAVDRGPAQITHDIYLPATVTEPLYMRLTRDGSNWTHTWSEDGVNWTQAGPTFPYTMTVNEVGLFAGNRGLVPPAHTVEVDYFHNGAGAPAAEDSLRNRLEVTVAGGGLVQRTLDKVDYLCGDLETLTAVDQPGWAFSAWSGGVTGSQNPVTVAMNGPLAVTATFVAVPQYTLGTTVAAGNGAVVLAPPGGTYNAGTVVTVSAAADLGWALQSWAGDLTGDTNPQQVTMAGNRAVSATFGVLDEHTLTVATLGHGSVTSDPAGGTYYHGTSVALTAVPDPGWVFGGWSGALSGQANPDTLLINGDKSVTATFLEVLTVADADDFNGCALDPRWTVVDPFNDGGVAAVINAYSDSARVAISVPGGTEHEIWNGFIGATHILQAAENTDFVLEVKFDSLPPSGYGQQGILVKQDQAMWVRSEVYRNDLGALRIALETGPAQVRHDLALPGGLQAPFTMRLTRSGSVFMQSWSADGVIWNDAGTSFSYAMAVTGVGAYAGNRGANPPAHTVLVDYFAVTAGPYAGEDAVRNRIDVQAIGSGAVNRTLNLVDYACGQVETMTAVADAGWYFAGWSGAASGTQNPLDVSMTGPVSLTATFQLLDAPNHVAVDPAPGTCLSTVVACADSIPVRITRTDSTPVKSFTVLLQLANLELCDGAASVREGDYLRAHGNTSFQAVENFDGSVQVDGVLLDGPCDADESDGVLFYLDLASTIADGIGSVTVAAVELRDCANAVLPTAALPAAVLPIDHTAPAPATGVAAAQVLSGNALAAQTAVDVTWSVPATPDAQGIQIWRKGFGSYPEFSDGGGSVPTVPAAGVDPATVGWQLAAVLPAGASALRDNPPVRDYWYYHVRVLDTCGNPAVSVTPAASLDYLLADVVGGPGNLGDNLVDAADVAQLTAAYGRADGQPGYANRLDVGPTANAGPFSLPMTDNVIDFEDLMIFSLSHGLNAGPGGGGSVPASPAPVARNFLMLDVAPLPSIGQTFTVSIRMEGDGTVQGLSIPLLWNNAAVQPVSVTPGALLAAQGGTAAVYMPQPGLVDAALLGLRQRGLSGAGVLAVVTFEVVGAGQPGLSIGLVDGRSQANAPLGVSSGGISATPDLPVLVVATTLHQNVPNPFNPQTMIAFDLARAGKVRLQVYGVDGRLVRVLANGDLPAGRHAFRWDGTDDDGQRMASGIYLTRLVTSEGSQTSRMTMLK